MKVVAKPERKVSHYCGDAGAHLWQNLISFPVFFLERSSGQSGVQKARTKPDEERWMR
jgi:hypothetical protein